MAAPLIELCDVTVRYRMGDEEIRALDRLSMVIETGELVAVTGASGSGKSTLMAIMGCLDRPDEGALLLNGRDMAGAGDAELAHVRNRLLGFVFQAFNLLPRTSALDNVALALDYRDPPIPRDERRARAAAALAEMGLAGLEDRTPSRLSGGQQQRVAIARALVTEPSLILADEPTGNLDSRTAHDIMDRMAALNRERGITIVLVTHEPDIAAYARRVITMQDGKILRDERKLATSAPPAEPGTPAAA